MGKGDTPHVSLLVSLFQTATAPIAFAAMGGHAGIVEHFLKLNDLDISLGGVSAKVTYKLLTCIRIRVNRCMYIYGSFSDGEELPVNP